MTNHPLKSIIFAEDDDDIREIATLSLEALGGFTVNPCASGEEVLEAVAGDQPDLFLLDVMMPGMDGPGVLMKLREMPATRGIPVIFMTAKVMKEEIQRFLEMGAVAVIHKPFDPERLPDQIREIWDKNNDE